LRIHNLSAQDLTQSLHTTVAGLDSAEAARRLIEFGPNIIKQVKQKSLFVRFLQGFTHFFALILWCGAALALFAEWKEPGTGMGLLSLAIFGVILVNGVFSFWQEYRAEESIAALKLMIPRMVKAYRDGELSELPTNCLVPGDLVYLEEGDSVPADCRLIEATGIRVNNSSLTGESIAVSRSANDSSEEDVLQSGNTLLAGTSVLAGHGKAFVFATGMETEFGKIAALTASAQESLSPLQIEIIRLSRIIACIAVSVGLVFFLIAQSLGMPLWSNIVFAVGLIVALVPEGLLPEVTLALATCSRRMAKRNALLRNLPSIETLGCASVICTDKTGTLTEGKMTVSQVYLCGHSFGREQFEACGQYEAVFREFCSISLNCENAKQGIKAGAKQMLGDPMELALVDFAKAYHPTLPSLLRVDEIPFDSGRKRLTTVHQLADNSLVLYCKGALETLLPLCTSIYDSGGVVELTDEFRQAVLEQEQHLANKGLRVLALGRRSLSQIYNKEDLDAELTLVGLVAMEDPPRPEVPLAISRCRKAGIRVIMLTGDHPNTALAIGKEIGLVQSDSPVVMCGADLKKLTEAQLRLMLGRQEVVFARIDADQKMRIVQTLQKLGHIVAVTGDGVNDAPALKSADIGIAMGRSGTDVAREASDMVLADDNFASIVSAVEEGRSVFSNIRKFLTYVLSSNIAELMPCLAYVLFKIPLPLTIIQILSVDLGTDLLPALALGTEKPDPAVMERPPRPRTEGLFDHRLLLRAYLYLGVMVSAASLIGYYFVFTMGGWRYGQSPPASDMAYKAATTACLMGIMCMQIVNSSICRSEQKSVFALGLFSNKLLNIGIAVQILLMMLLTYTDVGNRVFGTAPLPWQFWLMMLPMMIGMLFVEELRKWILRSRFELFSFKHNNS
jgi:calcium-translocating P-type ATPase